MSYRKKIYLNEIINWLNRYNKKNVKIKYKKIKEDYFFLNNKKLMSKIKVNNSKSELKKYCLKISKKRFY